MCTTSFDSTDHEKDLKVVFIPCALYVATKLVAVPDAVTLLNIATAFPPGLVRKPEIQPLRPLVFGIIYVSDALSLCEPPPCFLEPLGLTDVVNLGWEKESYVQARNFEKYPVSSVDTKMQGKTGVSMTMVATTGRTLRRPIVLPNRHNPWPVALFPHPISLRE